MAKIDLPMQNNNPFALIDETPDKWKGLVGKTPGHFLKFDTPTNGARAGFINLINAYLNRGHDTIEKIFPIYAPSGHGNNVPEDYIKRVVQLTGIPRNVKISTPEQIYKLGKAIVTHEEGEFWMNQKDFDEAFKAAMAAKKISIPTGVIMSSTVIIILVITLLIIL